MKTVVSVHPFVEQDIRPGELVARYRELSAEDVATRLLPAAALVTGCPACGAPEGQRSFVKLGLTYRHCPVCASLYVSPRPGATAVAEHYRSSRAATYWRRTVLTATAHSRHANVVVPHAQWILNTLAEERAHARVALDVSTYGGALLEALVAQSELTFIAAGPTADLDADAGSRVHLAAGPFERIAGLGPVDLVTAFEVFDRAVDPRQLADLAHAVLRPGGLLFLTAPASTGFDLQVLWDRSPLIAPPDRMNLFSIDGLMRLFSGPRWDVRELSTPGMFDAEIVRRAIEYEPNGEWPRFARTLLCGADERTLAAFQEFLQAHRLASFARVAVRKVA